MKDRTGPPVWVMPEEWVLVGQIGRPQALKGGFRVRTEVDYPEEIFTPGFILWVSDGKHPRSFEVEKLEVRQKFIVLKVSGINSIEDAEKIQGLKLYAERNLLPPLPEDSFYYYDMVGCKVILPDESEIGEVKEVQPGASGDIIVIRSGQKEVLVPAARDFVKYVDLTDRIVCVDPPEGMD